MSPLLNHDMHKFIRQWREIEKSQADLDFRKSQWARAVLDACGTERAFANWCKADLELNDYQVRELLARAATVKVVPDSTTWNRLGGFRQLEKVTTLPKREQVAVVEAAKAESLSIGTIMKQRGHVAAPQPSTLRTDIEALARFVLASDAPKDVKAIARKYIAEASKRAA